MSVQNEFAVHEPLAVWRHHPVSLSGAKDFFVEGERGEPVADDQMESELVLSMRRLLLFPRMVYRIWFLSGVSK